MKHYNLEEDEVILYKGKVILKYFSGETELVLTNKKFVFISSAINEINQEIVSVSEFFVNEVKEYKGMFQVLRKGNVIEIYFLHNEVEFAFEKGSESRDFMNATLKLLTGKNKFERGAEKFFGAKDCVDNSLHIDSAGIAKKALNLITPKKGFNISFGKKKDEK